MELTPVFLSVTIDGSSFGLVQEGGCIWVETLTHAARFSVASVSLDGEAGEG
jgi:hypothetical protein